MSMITNPTFIDKSQAGGDSTSTISTVDTSGRTMKHLPDCNQEAVWEAMSNETHSLFVPRENQSLLVPEMIPESTPSIPTNTGKHRRPLTHRKRAFEKDRENI
ncbi:hypothetical protein M8J75_011677 [Diaphorina citri]|nr:hypothetical protein M8J75_011677 [Diaphorina citri]KAI5752587.1 hypothetical protein M8J77_018383 [Diaphorina citri]